MENTKGITVSIDTTKIRESCVTVTNHDGLVLGKCCLDGKSQTILPVLDQALTDAHATIDDVCSIVAHCGPGSFTGIRVGVAVGKTLSLLLGIRCNGRHPWESVKIVYEKDKFACNPLQG
jgi:tRNA A37 threonylcarbamoyladenosine modification protein TsaB